MSCGGEGERKLDPREVERRLFVGLMRTKALPKVPGQTPTNAPDVSETKQPSQSSFADGSPALLALKEELLARGMSDEEAEAYIRQI